MHTTTAQNATHRADLTWNKVGRSEYLRGDGVTIRKMTNVTVWEILLPTGEPAQTPNQRTAGGFINMPARGVSLTIAKWIAEDITATSPAYTATQR